MRLDLLFELRAQPSQLRLVLRVAVVLGPSTCLAVVGGRVVRTLPLLLFALAPPTIALGLRLRPRPFPGLVAGSLFSGSLLFVAPSGLVTGSSSFFVAPSGFGFGFAPSGLGLGFAPLTGFFVAPSGFFAGSSSFFVAPLGLGLGFAPLTGFF
eukprot:209219-Pyramimonas_sp.AAC.1